MEKSYRLTLMASGLIMVLAVLAGAAPADAQRGDLGLVSEEFFAGILSHPAEGLDRAAALVALSPEEQHQAWAASFAEFLEANPNLNRRQLKVVEAAVKVGNRQNLALERGSSAWIQRVVDPLSSALDRALAVFPEELLDRSPFRQGPVQAYLLGLGFAAAGPDCDCSGLGTECAPGRFCSATSCQTKTVTVNGQAVFLSGLCPPAAIKKNRGDTLPKTVGN